MGQSITKKPHPAPKLVDPAKPMGNPAPLPPIQTKFDHRFTTLFPGKEIEKLEVPPGSPHGAPSNHCPAPRGVFYWQQSRSGFVGGAVDD
jgi:hypothetical protein